jgi:hypothetical protein
MVNEKLVVQMVVMREWVKEVMIEIVIVKVKMKVEKMKMMRMKMKFVVLCL